VADIISGRRRDWTPPDDLFIHLLEGRLDWVALRVSPYIVEQANKSKAFDLRVQRWMSDQGWTMFVASMKSGSRLWTTWPRPWPTSGRTG